MDAAVGGDGRTAGGDDAAYRGGVSVILLGSYAYGTPHKDSDVDLLVIMDSDARLAIGDFFIQEILDKGKMLDERNAA